MKDQKLVALELIKLGKYMMQYELAWGNAGNISARIDEETFLITASGTTLGELELDDLVVCSIDETDISPSGKKPSKEVPMHRAVYSSRPEIGCVIHSSPFYSTFFACSGETLPANWFVEDMYYLERVERVPYSHPGSERLGSDVLARVGKANIILLENHGVLVYDTTIKETRMALQTLETVARMALVAKTSGTKISGLPNTTVDDFLNHSGYKPRREWQ